MKKPKIRFPEFTETYIEYRLGDIYQERKERRKYRSSHVISVNSFRNIEWRIR